MTYQILRNNRIFTVRSDEEAKQYAEEGCTVTALTEMVIKDGALVPIEEAGTVTGTGSGDNPPAEPLKTGTA